MKKIIFSLGLAIVLILLNSFPAFGQTPYPQPKGYVNDFANVIPDDVEQRLEQTLRDYEAKTTNEIAVVTVESLDGQTVEDYTMGLAEQWGVGKRVKDNGVIILLALNERDVRIEVGYGLEPVLTDAKAGSIINKMIPFFKDGKYGVGLELGAKEVMGVIGFLTPEEIEQQKKEKEERNRAATATFLKVLMFIGIAVALVIFIVILSKKISAWNKEQKRKESVRQKTLKDIKTAEGGFKQIVPDIPKHVQYPITMIRELENLAADSARVKEVVEKTLQEARKLLKTKPDLAKSRVAEAQSLVGFLQKDIRAFEEKREAFDEARTSHLEKIQKADQSIKGTLVYLTGLKEKGYSVFPDKELAAARQDIKAAQDILSERGDVPDYHSVIKCAESAVTKARVVQDSWEKRLGIQRANSKNLNRLFLWPEQSFPQLKNSCQIALEQLKAKAPPEVWESLAKDAAKKEAMVEKEFGELWGEAERLNRIEKQEFEEAAKKIEKIYDLVKAAELSLRQPGKTLDGFITAQAEAKTLVLEAAQAINQAESAISDSDAEGAGRSKLQEAKEKVLEAKNLEKSDLPNWLLAAGLLAGALALARAAKSEAKNRADEVEGARCRKREQEERRRRDDDYHSSSSWSSGSSGGGGGGFGGFGGGSFGGGGASGHF